MHLIYSGCLLTCKSNAVTPVFFVCFLYIAKIYQWYLLKIAWGPQVSTNQEWEVANLGGKRVPVTDVSSKNAFGIKIKLALRINDSVLVLILKWSKIWRHFKGPVLFKIHNLFCVPWEKSIPLLLLHAPFLRKCMLNMLVLEITPFVMSQGAQISDNTPTRRSFPPLRGKTTSFSRN